MDGGAAHHHHHVGFHARLGGVAAGRQCHAVGQQHPFQQVAAHRHHLLLTILAAHGHLLGLVADDASRRRDDALQEGAAGASRLLHRQRPRRQWQGLALQVEIGIFGQLAFIGTEIAGNPHLGHLGLILHGLALGLGLLAFGCRAWHAHACGLRRLLDRFRQAGATGKHQGQHTRDQAEGTAGGRHRYSPLRGRFWMHAAG